MKRINVSKLLIVVVWFSLSAINDSYGQEDGTFKRIVGEMVPTSTQIKFYDLFKGAENVAWFTAGEAGAPQYRADYSFKGKSISLTFNAQNRVIKEVRSSKRIPVPVGVEEYFATNYKGFKLFKVSKVSMLDPQGQELPEIYFELDVKKGDRVILFRFEKDHEMFQGVDLALGEFTSN